VPSPWEGLRRGERPFLLRTSFAKAMAGRLSKARFQKGRSCLENVVSSTVFPPSFPATSKNTKKSQILENFIPQIS
jgi:hypothetical protein